MPEMNPAVTYGSYLKLDELLSLQQPRSDGEHDEMLFIIIHQVYELWFKELLHELDRVVRLLTGGEPHRAQHTLKRILTILKVMVAQLDILETMTPLEFLSFRARLEAASGFQSDQFRQIEFLLGAKSEAAIARFRGRTRARSADDAISRANAVGRVPPLPVAAGPRDSGRAALAHAGGGDRAVARRAARADRHLSTRSEERRAVRAAGRSRRRAAGVAVPPRQDGGADDRNEEWNRRIEWCRVSHLDRRETTVSGSLGHSRQSLTNPLAAHYSRFRVADRLLLTGHSHQAWPDAGFEGQQRAWLDAAEFVDDKWTRAEEQAAKVREGFARLLGDSPDNIALGQNTHELVTRWLSALPFHRRRRIVTTSGEFHTIRRQLDRLAEEGIEVITIAASPADDLADRVAREVDDRTLAVMMSSVLFETAEIVGGLDRVSTACETHGAACLVDAYHHLNVVPFDIRAMRLESAFITGGGYKYCQLGEGNGFLRVPPHGTMRPVLTGWFAEFDDRESTARDRVAYAPGAAAFAGATYDPTSHYRAAAVFDFHGAQQLTPGRLREISRHQVGLLSSSFAALDVDPSVAHVVAMPEDRRAGFLAIRAPRATELVRALRQASVFADARGDILRLGPAPYLSDDQLRDAVARLGRVVAAARPLP